MVDEAVKPSEPLVEAYERGVADGYKHGLKVGAAEERKLVLALAREFNYGPTLRTFAKWVARGKHEELPDGAASGGDDGR